MGLMPPQIVNQIPRIDQAAGNRGSFYIWVAPAEDQDLVNWSLNVVSKNPKAIELTTSLIAPYNEWQPPDPIVRRWEYVEEPTAANPGAILNLKGFSLFNDEHRGVGVGVKNRTEYPNADPWRAGDAWLLAQVDYEVGNALGSSEIYLQLGESGLAHCGMWNQGRCLSFSTINSAAVFGAATDTALNGSTDACFSNDPTRCMSSETPELVIRVTNADFNDDGFANHYDLSLWQESYGKNANGDADGDGDTDGRDLLAWQRQHRTGPPPGAANESNPFLVASSPAVPEPAFFSFFPLLVIIAGASRYREHT